MPVGSLIFSNLPLSVSSSTLWCLCFSEKNIWYAYFSHTETKGGKSDAILCQLKCKICNISTYHCFHGIKARKVGFHRVAWLQKKNRLTSKLIPTDHSKSLGAALLPSQQDTIFNYFFLIPSHEIISCVDFVFKCFSVPNQATHTVTYECISMDVRSTTLQTLTIICLNTEKHTALQILQNRNIWEDTFYKEGNLNKNGMWNT